MDFDAKAENFQKEDDEILTSNGFVGELKVRNDYIVTKQWFSENLLKSLRFADSLSASKKKL